MRAEAIFAPVSVLALWTGVVVLVTGARRIRAVRMRRVSRGAFRMGEAPEVPEDVAVANRNLMNLLEMPILFYVVTICFYVTHHVGKGPVVLAWIYVGLRLLHSWEHLTTNHVLRRLTAFALSNFVLVALWIRFVRATF
ncbi:MAG TPA: MAPEG family protein [Polyangia bacterium]|nr:MAPEG family protein [Polyangia bacterium]